MKVYKLTLACLLLLNIFSCKKKDDDIEPVLPPGNTYLYSHIAFAEMKSDGIKWATNNAGNYLNVASGNGGSFNLLIFLENEEGISPRTAVVQFKTNGPITPGVYSTASGNMLEQTTTFIIMEGTGSQQTIARYNRNNSQNEFTVTIDSVYGQGTNLLCFGKLDATLTNNANPSQTTIITEGKFGYAKK